MIESGRATVPLSVLSGLLGNLTSERLNIETKGATLRLTTDTYEAAIEGLAAEDFPLIPKIKNRTTYVELGGGVLREALGQVLASAQLSELRPELSSVLMVFSLNELRLVTTDSFRLSEKTIAGGRLKASAAQGQGWSALVPLKTATELARIIKDDDAVRMYYDQNQMLFTTERLEVVSRLIDGTFPDYAAILPKQFGTEATVNRADFMGALKLASVFSSRSGEVRIAVPDNKKTIRVYSAEHGVGENTNLIGAKVTGDPIEVSFNWRYLIDGLKAIAN